MIDPRGPRFGQALTGTLALSAYVLDEPWIVAGLALVLAGGAIGGPRLNLWGLLYRLLIARHLDPPSELEHPAPPRFAMTLGFLFLTASALILLVLPGLVEAWIGWVLALAVSGLALLAAATSVCVGCEIYVRIQRLRAPSKGRPT